MNLLKEFNQYIKEQNLFQHKDKLILAVSGGVDSVVLCHLCKQANFNFIIAHCNFQLRNKESERDEIFVKTLGEKYDVEVMIKIFDTNKYAKDNKISIQLAARELRYKWFDELLHKIKKDSNPELINCPQPAANWILTAHHANDNIETLLMNFFKGTGISGLHGILPKQANLIRPLLFAKKEALAEFALANNLYFVLDSSNNLDKYTRNYFRNKLIPDLKKAYPQVENNLLNNINRFSEIELLYKQSIELNKKKLLQPKGNEIHIPILKLVATKPLHTLLYEIIKDYNFTPNQTDEVAGLLKSETGKYIQSATHRIFKNRNWIVIAPKNTDHAQHILIEKEGIFSFTLGSIQVNKVDNISTSISSNLLAVQLNLDEIKFPLLLRKAKQGDYFYPLGMMKKKKLSRFFTDQKLSLTQKEKTWVIEMDKKIIWVVGMRIDERFKIEYNTKKLLQLILIVTE